MKRGVHFGAGIGLVGMLMAGTALVAQGVRGHYGQTGYIDMPSAFVPKEGDTSYTLYDNGGVSGSRVQFQATRGLTLGINLGTYDNYLGLGDIDDRSFDLRFQILQEDEYLPAIAIGADDVFGVGPRSAEYIVASKSFGFGTEASLGVGWGRLGSHEPFYESDARPDYNPHDLTADALFSGDAALFGGLSVALPFQDLKFVAEYSSDAQVGEEIGGAFTPSSAYSMGLVWEPAEMVSAGIYLRNGDDIGFKITFAGNPNEPVVGQDNGRGPAPIVPRVARGADMSPAWAASREMRQLMRKGLEVLVENEGYTLVSAEVAANEMRLYVRNTKDNRDAKMIGRVAAALAKNAPGSVETFRIIPVNDDDLPTTAAIINRSTLERQAGLYDAAVQSYAATDFVGAAPITAPVTEERDAFDYSLGLAFDLDSFGQSESTFAVTPLVDARYDIARGLSLNGTLALHLYDAPEIAELAPSRHLADGVRVRSDRLAYGEQIVTLDRLTADYATKIGGNVYARATAGLIERQYAGVSGEILWADPALPFAVGGELSRVVKREHDNPLGFDDYETTTGFVSLYLDPGYKGIETEIHIGEYLAGDTGATVEFSRQFRNGWRVAAGVTATEVYSDSKDTRDLIPSFSVAVPLQWATGQDTTTMVGVGELGTISDVGARLNVAERLHDQVGDYDAHDFEMRWMEFWQ